MKIENLLTPEEAEKVMRMSRATITRNKQAGAPVHPISTKGRKYLIDPEEFQSQGKSTPFSGWRVYGRCLATVCDGKLVWLEKVRK